MYKSEGFKSNFPKVLILNCVSDFCSQDFKDQLVSDLLDAINPAGSVNYFLREDSAIYRGDKSMPTRSRKEETEGFSPRSLHYIKRGDLPDDIDDTVCTYLALHRVDKNLITGEIAARLAKLLVHNEVAVGGPYYTWFLENHTKDDIDPVVNANVACLLQNLNIKLPKLLKHLQKCVNSKSFVSLYYAGEIPAVYFFSRIDSVSLKRILKKPYLQLVTNLDTANTNIQDLSLLLSSGINLCVDNSVIEPLLNKIIHKLPEPITWHPFVNERLGATTEYLQSPALTCAFICEALYKYIQTKALTDHVASPHLNIEIFKNRLKFELSSFPQQLTNEVLEKYFSPKRAGVMTPTLIEFGCDDEDLYINTLGWFAYGIYDQILDEKKDFIFLPILTFVLRKIYLYYGAFGNEIFDQLDIACSHEVQTDKNKKFFDLSILYKKSFGCVLPFLKTLNKKVVTPESSDSQNLIKFFRHYLITKQLNDDAHDWEIDLKNGMFTYPLFLLKKQAYGKTSDLRNSFWQQIFPQILKTMTHHLNQSEKYLQRIDFRIDKTPLINLVNKQRQSIATAKLEQAHALDFLATYSIVSL